jgi:hypothetical protein
MHLILYQRKRKKNFLSNRISKFIFCYFSGIFHSVKDNYFRTSLTSSDDEYDSDDSTRKVDNTKTNAQNKSQPLVGTFVSTAAVANAVVAATSTSIQTFANDGKR